MNSSKRLVPGHEAPVQICWGYRNRPTLVRVPLFSDVPKVSVEFRSPDATANVYLALAAMVAAGMDGARSQTEAPEERAEDVYTLSANQLRRLRVKSLPGTLGEALDELAKEEVVRRVGAGVGAEVRSAPS